MIQMFFSFTSTLGSYKVTDQEVQAANQPTRNMTLHDKVSHIHQEIQNLLSDDGEETVNNSLFRFYGNTSLTFKNIRSILDKIVACERLFKDQLMIPHYNTMTMGLMPQGLPMMMP